MEQVPTANRDRFKQSSLKLVVLFSTISRQWLPQDIKPCRTASLLVMWKLLSDTLFTSASKITHHCFIHQQKTSKILIMTRRQNILACKITFCRRNASVLPAVACKISRVRKQQIETVAFMMAARRTLKVSQTIYTKAGRLKYMQREEVGHRVPAGGGAEIPELEVLQVRPTGSKSTNNWLYCSSSVHESVIL